MPGTAPPWVSFIMKARFMGDALCAAGAAATVRPGRRSRPGVTLPFLVKQAVDIIEKDYASLDGVEELAERLQISASHLCREFVRALGVGPLACLTRVRLQCAANLLTKTNRKIEDIAIACGFSNGNYFAKVFKKYLGTSPRDFRNNDETDNHNITL